MSKKKLPNESINMSRVLASGSGDLRSTLDQLLPPGAHEAVLGTESNITQSPNCLRGRLTTLSQKGAGSVFSRHSDALVFTIDVELPESPIEPQVCLKVNLQVVDYHTNMVVRDVWSCQRRLKPGMKYRVNHGNNSGRELENYTTPRKWGLDKGMYLLRAVIEVRSLGLLVPCANECLFRIY